ncbi:MAG: hypothetical protein P8X55_06480 [Desulfosarcinaceae bacterium]
MYFIANFNHLTDQQKPDESDRRHGTFSMMVEADTTDNALIMFRERLVRLKKTTSLFSGQCTIYINQLLEFPDFPKNDAVLINLKSFVGDPVMPCITCVVPTEDNNACHIQTWEDNQPLNEGQADRIFMQFD